MKYDLTIKELLVSSPGLILELTGQHVKEFLTVEFPSTAVVRPDLVLRLDSGVIFHLEIQTRTDPTMSRRMLDYYLALWDLFGETPEQCVLYIGAAQTGMSANLVQPKLEFRCEVRDVRTIEPEALLESERPGDQILAMLCKGGTDRTTLQRILGSLMRLEGREREIAFTQLLVLSGLRTAKNLIQEELRTMPVELDIEDNEFLMEVLQRGEAKGEAKGQKKGEAKMLRIFLEGRFGTLPAWAEERLRTATPEMLRDWASRLMKSPETLADVLGPQSE